MSERVMIVTAWHRQEQRDLFCKAWNITTDYPNVLLVQDVNHEGCAATKNKGVEVAMRQGAEIVVVLDDDCFPSAEAPDLETLAAKHSAALNCQDVDAFRVVTNPPSRGTPYFNRTTAMPVAASMGFWNEVPDYDAAHQLVNGARHPMEFHRATIYGQYFPLCGMNLAFRPRKWLPWCRFINVPRFDDIWMGWLWQKKAYAEGYCFNLNGPLITHSRQSYVFQNMRDEAKYLEHNEILWSLLASSPEKEYDKLVKLLPVK